GARREAAGGAGGGGGARRGGAGRFPRPRGARPLRGAAPPPPPAAPRPRGGAARRAAQRGAARLHRAARGSPGRPSRDGRGAGMSTILKALRRVENEKAKSGRPLREQVTGGEGSGAEGSRRRWPIFVGPIVAGVAAGLVVA